MKNIFTLCIAFILLTSFHPRKENLGLNLTVGEIYVQNMNLSSSIIQTVDGKLINTNVSADAKMTYKVTGIQNSVYDMEVQYESLKMKISLASITMEFSSEINDETDIFSTILSSMKNKPFLVKMSRNGKVLEVSNIDSVFAGMFDKFPQLTDVQRQQIQTQLKQAYGENAFKGNIEMYSAIFPDSPVTEGDKWTIKVQMESGMIGEMETVYELREIGDSSCQISGNSKIETTTKNGYVETNGIPLKYDLKGTMISDIKINRKSGWIMSAKISQSIKGTAFVQDSPRMPGGMSIPITVNNDMDISD